MEHSGDGGGGGGGWWVLTKKQSGNKNSRLLLFEITDFSSQLALTSPVFLPCYRYSVLPWIRFNFLAENGETVRGRQFCLTVENANFTHW